MSDQRPACRVFVRKRPWDPGGIMFCRRCGLHIEVHPPLPLPEEDE